MAGDAHGPIDFVLIEFPTDRLTGRAADEVLRLVDSGTIRLLDVLFVGKSLDGEAYAVDLAEVAAEEAFGELTGARSGLLNDEDVAEAASALEPGRIAALIVYENTWAIRFIEAARESGGEIVASARIPASDVMEALEALEALDA
jgi:Family of unknown function (DUF6325)